MRRSKQVSCGALDVAVDDLSGAGSSSYLSKKVRCFTRTLCVCMRWLGLRSKLLRLYYSCTEVSHLSWAFEKYSATDSSVALRSADQGPLHTYICGGGSALLVSAVSLSEDW